MKNWVFDIVFQSRKFSVELVLLTRLVSRLKLSGISNSVYFAMSRKPCSGYKMKEMTGSGIFAGGADDEASEPGSANPTPNSKSGIRLYQVPNQYVLHLRSIMKS